MRRRAWQRLEGVLTTAIGPGARELVGAHERPAVLEGRLQEHRRADSPTLRPLSIAARAASSRVLASMGSNVSNHSRSAHWAPEKYRDFQNRGVCIMGWVLPAVREWRID